VRVLILGGTGKLGHIALRALKNDLDVYVTVRSRFAEVENLGIFDKNNTICGFNAENFLLLEEIIKKIKPDIILNCIGIIKQLKEARDPIKSIMINSLLPHEIAVFSQKYNFRLIHISTDCVFSGRKGNYSEADDPDPSDLYGRTKLLGEAAEGNVLTLRTSLIGRELSSKYGLLEWFLSQNGKTVTGYTKAIFSGFTTSVLSGILKDIILNHSDIKGLYHVSSSPISKFDLLMLIKKKMGLNIDIIPDKQFNCDRSLDSSKFCREANYKPPSWDVMIEMLAEEVKKGEK
jgi:dTDP-4-dehydrorhamnose reductase